MTIQDIRDKISASHSAIEVIRATAKTDEREVSPEEMALIENHLDAAEAAQADLTQAEEHEATINAQSARIESLGESLVTSRGRHTQPESTVIEVMGDLEAERPFANLGEQLQAVFRAAQPNIVAAEGVDKRLLFLSELEMRAASGMNTVIDSEGGFPIQTDFAGMIMESAATAGEILSRLDTFPIGPQSNSAKWIDVDETSVATTVFGGVQVYYAAEAATVTKSQPVLKERELVLKKLMGIAYATSEQLEDTTFITELYNRAFALAIQRKAEGDVIDGDGAGKPLGIINGANKGLVTVPKETGQVADSILYANLAKMWTRQLNKTESVWLTHPDMAEELLFMEFPIGTGGVPVFLPPGGASQSGLSTLFGRPILETDHCSAVGTKGDIVLGDLKDYLFITKGGVRSETSMHVRFLNDEQTFRFIFRLNGQPKNRSPLTIKNSSKTRSTFVTLASRD